MENPHYRYFIELQPPGEQPRFRENEARRALAQDFIGMMQDWMREGNLRGKVSGLDVTMFGQIQITCEPTVINLIRNQDVVNVAAIRQSGVYAESLNRWVEAR